MDRYSSWPVVAKLTKTTSSELCSLFRQYFMTYGAAEEIVSDGGKQYVSEEFGMFLKRWNVSQYVSTAYNPH